MNFTTDERVLLTVECPHCEAQTQKLLGWLLTIDEFFCYQCGQAIVPLNGDNGVRLKELAETCKRIDSILNTQAAKPLE